MPTKRNKNGMQEYIPAGNGDISGEYADGSGSNKHFTSFGKTTTTTQNKTENKLQETKTQENNSQQKEQEKHLFHFVEESENFKESGIDAKQLYGNLTPEGKELFEKAIKSGVSLPHFTFSTEGGSYFSIKDYVPVINISPENIKDRYFNNEGSTLYHEFTHWITNNKVVKFEDKNGKVGYEIIGLAPLFEGKSFTDIIREEAKNLNRKKIVKDLIESQNKAINDALSKYGYNEEKLDQLSKDIGQHPKFLEKKYKLQEDYANGKISIKEANAQLKNFMDELKENNPELKEKYELKTKLSKVRSEAAGTWVKQNGLSCVSDMLSGNKINGEKSGFRIGHSASYFAPTDIWGRKVKSDNYSNEFTSEIVAAIATGDNKIIEKTKELLPKSYEAFEYIYKNYYLGDKK